jgi:hypothetical protein
MMEQQKAEAQQALNNLFSEHLLPFEITAHEVEPIGREEYIVRFYDSRIRSVEISCQGRGFKQVFRAAVLKSLRGSLLRKTAA